MGQAASIERYHGADVPCPSMAGIGHSRQTSARRGLWSHAHTVYEVCLIARGSPVWFIDNRDYPLSPGLVFFTRPDQRHGNRHGMIEPCDLRWLQFKVDDSAAARRVANIRRATWLADPKLVEWHEAMLQECRVPRPDSASVLASWLEVFLHALVRCERNSAPTGQPHPAVTRARQMMKTDPARRWSIDQLDAAVNVGRTRLYDLFRQQVGMTPLAYARRLRLRCAQQMLRETDISVTAIAHELGFSSSQHLATAFGQHYGLTPTAYRDSPRM